MFKHYNGTVSGVGFINKSMFILCSQNCTVTDKKGISYQVGPHRFFRGDHPAALLIMELDMAKTLIHENYLKQAVSNIDKTSIETNAKNKPNCTLDYNSVVIKK
jgi:hypothetical protein